MLEKILGITMSTTITDLGALAALTSIIVQVLKKIVPSKFPTQALVIIVALFVTTLASVMFYGVMLKAIGVGLISGFVVAFIAMEGFDSLKNIWTRFTLKPTMEEDSIEANDEMAEEIAENNFDCLEDGGEG